MVQRQPHQGGVVARPERQQGTLGWRLSEGPGSLSRPSCTKTDREERTAVCAAVRRDGEFC